MQIDKNHYPDHDRLMEDIVNADGRKMLTQEEQILQKQKDLLSQRKSYTI